MAPVLRKMLREEDLDKMTLRKIMNSLSDHFDIPVEGLSVRKKYVRAAIESFLESDYKPAAGSSNKKQEDEVYEDNSEEEDDDDDDGMKTDEFVDDDDDDEEPKKAKKRKRKSAAETTPGGPKMGVAGTQVKLSSFERAVVLREPLENFLGEKVLPRTHVAKRITAYAKENGLQDTTDRRKINCDAALTELFGGGITEFTFFSINKLIPNLLFKRDEINDNTELMALCTECDARTLAEKQRVYDDKVARGEPVGKAPRAKAKGRSTKKMKENGETPTKRKQPDYQLSKELQQVCGGEEVMSRMQVMKKIWVYIKEKKLNAGKVITCDDNLKAIFDGEETVGMGFMKYLSPHLTKM